MAGDTRELFFSDFRNAKSTALEEILTLDYPNYHSYKVYDFSDPALSLLLESILGEWTLEQLEPKQTKVTWSYTFFAKIAHRFLRFNCLLELSLKDLWEK